MGIIEKLKYTDNLPDKWNFGHLDQKSNKIYFFVI
jgi:hypothetical protein